MTERAEVIRTRMRQTWGQRTAGYTAFAAPQTAAYATHLLALVAP